MTEHTLTDPPIEFEWYLAGPNGARFVLYPERGRHTEDNVSTAKRWLHAQRDVVSLQVRWKAPGDNGPNPEKIPDFILLKEAQKKAGQREAYIEELEEKLRQNEIALDRDIRKQIKSEEMYKSLHAQLKKKEEECNRLRKQISDLIIRLNSKNDSSDSPLK